MERSFAVCVCACVCLSSSRKLSVNNRLLKNYKYIIDIYELNYFLDKKYGNSLNFFYLSIILKDLKGIYNSIFMIFMICVHVKGSTHVHVMCTLKWVCDREPVNW